ncbi:hypothetical protein [Conexibacter sp. CPCC 206217]|uniref:hypothetical protein n=1 Tax=Conexibacter sp. CPCC 206217 TaxID=3064574 RepID=UPI0027253596|nr:hypothetical protein [Conexibacter sp. CPCC 206217]MDO8213347.1 hypothetical protein [Conexibacter sp. CPCC 206217]
MSELDFLDGLERDLADAARRRRDARRAASVVRLRERLGLRSRRAVVASSLGERLGLRRAVLAALLFVLAGAATAGATFAVLRASVIPGPAAHDVPRDQLPAAGTARVSELRAADPVPGRPVWTLRLARSSTGLLCTTVGQLVGGRFGLIGSDGRFRAYGPRVADSCGAQVSGPHASLLGARVFAARRLDDVRTLVNGVGGDELRTVTIIARGRRIAVPIGAGGTFVHALAGYPEDSALRVELRFADGRVEPHDFGVAKNVEPDPEGARAWRVGVSAAQYSSDRDRCVDFRPARVSMRATFLPSTPPVSPAACGHTRRGVPVDGNVYFAARRIVPGTGGRLAWRHGTGNWGDMPARTAVWGGFGADVARIDVIGPGSQRRTPALGRRHVFLAVFPADVDPDSLRVRVRLRDGTVEEHRGDTGLIEGRWVR